MYYALLVIVESKGNVFSPATYNCATREWSAYYLYTLLFADLTLKNQ